MADFETRRPADPSGNKLTKKWFPEKCHLLDGNAPREKDAPLAEIARLKALLRDSRAPPGGGFRVDIV